MPPRPQPSLQKFIEEKAKAAGLPVNDYKAQFADAIETMRKKLETSAQKGYFETVNGTGEEKARTPLGGHNPRALGAPSYAQATS